MADDKAGLQLTNVAECLYRRGDQGTFYAVIKRHGRQFRRSLKTKDRKLADRRLATLQEQVGRIAQPELGDVDCFSALAKRWLDKVRHHYKPRAAQRVDVILRNLAPFFDRVPLKKVTPALCEAWERKRGSAIAASTFNGDLGVLRMVFEFGVAQGLILDNPARGTKRRKMGKTIVVPPTKEQFQQLLAAMRGLNSRAEQGTNLVELLAYSGMRLSEATSLTWGDVDFDGKVFRVTGGEGGTKNREQRQVPLFPALRDLLERLRLEEPPTPDTHVVEIGTAKTAIASACKKAGFARMGHHALRHFFVSNAIEAGVDFATIAAWVGHKDGGVLVAKTYGHLRQSHSAAMAERMTMQ